ncbi:MAG: hypothetical protein WBM17_06720 [Anaerolineales bacterium]
MNNKPTMDFSRRLYGGLLNLYPRDFLDEFGASMLQLFTDQCRSAVNENGTRGMMFLWLRTISDLFVSLLREHLASPRASLGLLEAVPNKPLPWKGVVLVMIPGLVFFIGQIGQLTGEDWFFLLVYRAAYYLIIPVLLVWVIKKKLPLWGLIPLAMIYRTLIDVAFRMEYILESSLTKIYVSPSSWIAVLYKKFPPILKIVAESRVFLKTHSDNIKIVIVTALFASIVLLIVWIARRYRFPRAARVWLGVFALITFTQVISGLVTYLTDYQWTVAQLVNSADLKTIVKDTLYSGYYYATLDFGFLLLILVGGVMARRHGRLALLLPLGYLIPAVLLGRFAYDPRMPFLLVAAGAAVLIYRIFVTIVAPLWIVRSASDRAKMRAGTIGLLAAVAFIAMVDIIYMFAASAAFGLELSWANMYYTISPELIKLAGIGLAISLYKREMPVQARPDTALQPATA